MYESMNLYIFEFCMFYSLMTILLDYFLEKTKLSINTIFEYKEK